MDRRAAAAHRGGGPISMNRTSFHWLLLALLMQTPAQAEQRLELQGTSIIGSRESP